MSYMICPKKQLELIKSLQKDIDLQMQVLKNSEASIVTPANEPLMPPLSNDGVVEEEMTSLPSSTSLPSPTKTIDLEKDLGY